MKNPLPLSFSFLPFYLCLSLLSCLLPCLPAVQTNTQIFLKRGRDIRHTSSASGEVKKLNGRNQKQCMNEEIIAVETGADCQGGTPVGPVEHITALLPTTATK